jgi:hypothetical protein
VRYATVQSTADGLVGKDLPKVEGPAGLIMTTTANALHPGDESRMLSVHINVSRERTKAILAVQAGVKSEASYAPDFEKWHALHKLIALGDFKVEIPFAPLLSEHLPLDHFRIGRDFPQVLSLIRAHALMHQFRRERDSDGTIIATLDDYAAVYALVAHVLAEALEAAVPDRIREIVQAVKRLLKQKKPGGEHWRCAREAILA